jgi:hypothetical protein
MTAKLQTTWLAVLASFHARAAAVRPRAAVARATALASMATALAAWSIFDAAAPVRAEDRAIRSTAATMPPAISGRPRAGNLTTVLLLPAEKLQGTRLVDRDANLSIDRPGPGWEWSSLSFSAPELRNVYAATNSRLGRRLLVMVFEPSLTSLPPSFPDGVRKSLPNGGAGVVFEDVPVPPGAKRYRFSAQRGGTTFHCTDYIVATGHPVVFQSCSPAPGDPPELGPWMASFRTLRRVSPPPANRDAVYRGYFWIVFFVVVGIGGIINHVAGRLVVDSWKIGGFAVATLALILVAAPFAVSRLADADRSAYLIGTVLASTVLPLILSVAGSHWVRRRRERQARAPIVGSDSGSPPAD